MRITSLSEEVETAKDILAAVKPSILFPHCGQSKRRPLSLQESSRRPSLAAVRLRSVKQLLILPALQNGLGPDWLMSNFDMWLLLCSLLAQAFDRHFCGTAFNTTESGRCGP